MLNRYGTKRGSARKKNNRPSLYSGPGPLGGEGILKGGIRYLFCKKAKGKRKRGSSSKLHAVGRGILQRMLVRELLWIGPRKRKDGEKKRYVDLH